MTANTKDAADLIAATFPLINLFALGVLSSEAEGLSPRAAIAASADQVEALLMRAGEAVGLPKTRAWLAEFLRQLAADLAAKV